MATTLVAAIRNKYEETEDEDETNREHFIVFVTKSKATTENGILVPSILTLNNGAITEAGDENELRSLCRNITELDLTDNHITEWSEVYKILSCMPKVHFVNLSGNTLGGSQSQLDLEKAFDAVTHLILNSTAVTWTTVIQLLACFPSLQELHLSLNGYLRLEFSEGLMYPSLQQIFLNENCISNWSEICKLGQLFPNMDQLLTLGNPIEALTGDTNLLKNVKTINISKSRIKDWTDISKFSELENLVDLRLKPIPLFEGLPEKEARQLCIAYLPNIERLNGSEVTSMERVDAERAFIRRFMDQDIKPPRYFELEKQYGKLDHLAKVDLRPPTHVEVTLAYLDTEQTIKIGYDQTVSELKKNLEKYAGVPARTFRLFHLDVEGMFGLDELRLPNIKVSSIPIRDGDRLEIRLKT